MTDRAPIDEAMVDRAARAMFDRDMRKSFEGRHRNEEMIWRRTSSEYRRAALVALRAALEGRRSVSRWPMAGMRTCERPS